MKFLITKIHYTSDKVVIFECDSAEEKVPVKWIKVKTFTPWLIDKILEGRYFEPTEWYPTIEKYVDKRDGLEKRNYTMILTRAKFGVIPNGTPQVLDNTNQPVIDVGKVMEEEIKIEDEDGNLLIDWGD